MRRPGVLIILAALSGCDASRPATTATTARDSAGFTIVENRGGRWGEGDHWRVPAEPRSSIGVLDGDVAYQFVDISAATRRTDGGIVVADAGSRTVRLYGTEGVFEALIGSGGQGPGEFQNPAQILLLAGDSIAVWDDAARRITTFDPAGNLAGVRTVSLPGSGNAFSADDLRTWAPDPEQPALYPGVTRLLGNGDLLIRLIEKSPVQKKAGAGPGRADPAAGRTRRRSGALRTSPDLAAVDTVMFFGDIEEVSVEAPWGPQTVVPPLARNTSIALQPNEPRVCIGDQTGPEVRCFDSAGAALILRWQPDPLPVRAGDPDMETWRESTRESYGMKISPDDVERLIARVPVPVERPPYSSLVLDRDGNLWVRRGPARDGRDEVDEYLVFDRSGDLLGSLDVPAIRILEIGADCILGVREDELGVQYIEVYEILKPAGPSTTS